MNCKPCTWRRVRTSLAALACVALPGVALVTPVAAKPTSYTIMMTSYTIWMYNDQGVLVNETAYYSYQGDQVYDLNNNLVGNVSGPNNMIVNLSGTTIGEVKFGED